MNENNIYVYANISVSYSHLEIKAYCGVDRMFKQIERRKYPKKTKCIFDLCNNLWIYHIGS